MLGHLALVERGALKRLTGISGIARWHRSWKSESHCLAWALQNLGAFAIEEKVAVLRGSCQWGWTFLVNHKLYIIIYIFIYIIIYIIYILIVHIKFILYVLSIISHQDASYAEFG